MKCCICGVEVEGYGHNPEGAMWKEENGNIVEPEFESGCRCCDMCNQMYVIPGRLYKLNHRHDKEGK